MKFLPAHRLRALRALSFFLILIERLSTTLWPAITVGLALAGLWLFRAQTVFAPWLQWTISIGGGLIVLALLIRGLARLRIPRSKDIDRRIEGDSGLRHAPLSAQTDTLANPGTEETEALWIAAKLRFTEALNRLRLPIPRAQLPELDPRALRVAALLFAMFGVLVAGPHWDERLSAGIAPTPRAMEATDITPVSIWLTPPDYTGLDTLFIHGDKPILKDTTEIPAGSQIKILYHAVWPFSAPELVIGQRTWPLTPLGERSFGLEMPVPEGENIRIKDRFWLKADLPYTIKPDRPPVLSVDDSATQITPEGAMRFTLSMNDDYGVRDVTMHMTLANPVSDQPEDERPLGDDYSETRNVISPANTDFTMRPVYDLTDHPWAGLPVAITFTARDATEQSITTAPVTMPLPERQFNHPVAQALVQIRKALVWSPADNYGEHAETLENIMIRPGLYHEDWRVFLGLRMASSRLYYADPPSQDTARSMIPLLWDLALRVEDGNLSLAARDMRRAQQALENALNDPEAKADEIAQLMAELRQKMAAYFQEMAREMQKRAAANPDQRPLPPEAFSQMISPNMVGDMLQQLEDALRSGDAEKAREIMGQMQRLMDMMDPSMQVGMPQDMQAMQDSIQELQKLIDQQKALLAETREMRDLQRRMTPSAEAMEALQTRQKALRFALEQIMTDIAEKVGQIPPAMGQAEQEMRNAATRLGRMDARSAAAHQEKALKYLEDSQQQMSQKLAQRMQQMVGFSLGGMRFDPLGRPYRMGDQEGGPNSGVIEIPDEQRESRAREIEQELRKRSSERDRPREELEYLRRLLRRF